MSPTELAAEHRAQQQQTAADVESEGVRLWRQVDRAHLGGSWQESMARLAVVLTGAQQVAASRADGYTDSVLRELNVDADPAGEVNPRALAGQAADGRSLRSLLMSPVITTRIGLSRGATMDRALAGGLADLQTILRTEVADAGRVADGVAVAARPTVGYVRHLSPPSCPRCVILAGAFYRYSSGFARHPFCDCYHVPAPESEAGGLATDPKRIFDEGQIRGLSKADAQAIRDGADMNRVINAHRGMYTADGGRKLTRALAGGRGVPRLRLRPETIYKQASSRAEAISMLRTHGYIR